MSKHGIIGRVTQLARANVDAIITSAQDPQRMLDQLIGAYTTNVAEAEQAIVQLTDNLRLAADDQQEDAWAVAAWGRKAEAASQGADELRAAGEADDADRFDHLARAALGRQMIAENDVEIVEHIITAQHESIDTLSHGVSQMKSKLTGLKRRQDALAPGSASTASATTGVPLRGAITMIEIMDPSSEVTLFEEEVRQAEARSRDAAEWPASPQDAQFPALDDMDKAAIEERLKAVKAGRAMASVQAKVRAQAQDQPLR
ncbi:MAG TPA: PspA/IM30 family protein [Streptosporangiaceae bacterium]|nr:PspA/IM30 family protein [Streptosporangiaceae bacterium]